VLVLAAGTGLRQGERLGLGLGQVDFLRRFVKVERQLVGVKDGQPILGPPKTQASYRTVPLPAVVVEALAAHLTTDHYKTFGRAMRGFGPKRVDVFRFDAEGKRRLG
jgi:integrase